MKKFTLFAAMFVALFATSFANAQEYSASVPIPYSNLEVTAGVDFGMMAIVIAIDDNILNKAGNQPPTGEDVPDPPTYDPNTGPHKPTTFWEPIDPTKTPVFRGGSGTTLSDADKNSLPKGDKVYPSDIDKKKSPKGLSGNTDPENKFTKNNTHIVVWIPEDIKITQQGGGQPGDESGDKPKTPTTHVIFEPKIEMTKDEFQTLLDRIILEKVVEGEHDSGSTNTIE